MLGVQGLYAVLLVNSPGVSGSGASMDTRINTRAVVAKSPADYELSGRSIGRGAPNTHRNFDQSVGFSNVALTLGSTLNPVLNSGGMRVGLPVLRSVQT